MDSSDIGAQLPWVRVTLSAVLARAFQGAASSGGLSSPSTPDHCVGLVAALRSAHAAPLRSHAAANYAVRSVRVRERLLPGGLEPRLTAALVRHRLTPNT
ncbi:hypothetical protein AMYX_16810 [Anaeromyxobacter diazotrophicus]|uniref:Uncharacterized protein n=1 Tax=Anaeromyxobacter diazotrophicus TaxID=2590199 RepID=A0A7I9VLD9_9BACT|nr:hypothetical protein AMYX_16810 [Anaeromyxobacter diazotrophicus]